MEPDFQIQFLRKKQRKEEEKKESPSKNEKTPIGLDFDKDEYLNNHPRRGKAIIFNHLKYKNQSHKERKGSELDAERLQEELKAVGFEVEELENRTYEQIKKKLKQSKFEIVVRERQTLKIFFFLAAEEDHRDADCLVVVVMTHGAQIHPKQKKAESKGGFSDEKYSMQALAAYDKCYDERELFEPFDGDKCKSLFTKPKIFIIQVRNRQ